VSEKIKLLLFVLAFKPTVADTIMFQITIVQQLIQFIVVQYFSRIRNNVAGYFKAIHLLHYFIVNKQLAAWLCK